MASVAEVVPVPVVTRIPGAPAWLSGVVNWRGRVLPVIDLRPLVGAPLSPLPTSARLVVLADGRRRGRRWSRTWCRGCSTATPATSSRSRPPSSTGIAPLVRGVVDVDGPVALLATDAVLRLRDAASDGSPSHRLTRPHPSRSEAACTRAVTASSPVVSTGCVLLAAVLTTWMAWGPLGIELQPAGAASAIGVCCCSTRWRSPLLRRARRPQGSVAERHHAAGSR